MTLSVCMGMYNGEKYMEEQLSSILRQTRKADEVILCDDNSTDRTVEIASRFIIDNGLQESWKLYCNSANKGYPGNFYYAMSLCTKDVVFLADQDDIWDEKKLERMSAVWEEEPKASVVACRFDLIDADGKNIQTIMKPSGQGAGCKIQKVNIDDIFYRYEWPGMVLAYKNEWYRKWDKAVGEIPHDIFLCSKAAEEGAFWQINEILAWHRRHGHNTAAEEHRIGKLLNKKRKLWEIEKYIEMLNQFEECQVFQTEEGRRVLQEKQKAIHGRYEALQSQKVIQVLKSAWENRRNVRLATVVCDVLIVKR